MVSTTDNYQAAYQAIVDAHRAEMDRNLAEFHRQYGERVKKLEEIIQQAQKSEGDSSTIGQETTFATTRKGRHQASGDHSTFTFGRATTTNGDSVDNPCNSQAPNPRGSHTPRSQGAPRGGGIRAIRS